VKVKVLPIEHRISFFYVVVFLLNKTNESDAFYCELFDSCEAVFGHLYVGLPYDFKIDSFTSNFGMIININCFAFDLIGI
jgi:hypothetical protein